MKSALITGITGQDGSYLAEFLLEKGYTVHGMVRSDATKNITGHPRLFLHAGKLEDCESIQRLLELAQPDEIYNLGGVSHDKTSFDTPEYTAQVNAVAVLQILEEMRKRYPKAKLFQASSAELFARASTIPQNEKTPFQPGSPYGAAKLYAFWMISIYRDSYGLHASNGILFNHESPRRPETFVTRKITQGVASIKLGLKPKLVLGNLNTERDWGYAKDFIEGMWRMLQQEKPGDFVLATGRLTPLRQFVEEAFRAVGVEIEWEGEGVDEKGVDRDSRRVLVEVSSQFFRPGEVHTLQGDATKAKKVLGWEPQTSLEDLVKIMVSHDLDLLENQKKLHDALTELRS